MTITAGPTVVPRRPSARSHRAQFDAPRTSVRGLHDPQLIPEMVRVRGTDRRRRPDGRQQRELAFESTKNATDARRRPGPPTERLTAAEGYVQDTSNEEGHARHVSVEDATLRDLGDRTKVTHESAYFHRPRSETGDSDRAWMARLHENYAALDELLARLGSG